MGAMKMQITVCGVHLVTEPNGVRLQESDGLDPIRISVNGTEAEVHLCEDCRPAMAASLHTMMQAGGIDPGNTGMAAYLPSDDEEEEYEDEEEDWEEEEEEEVEEAALKQMTPIEKLRNAQRAENALIPEDEEEEAESAKVEIAAKRPKSTGSRGPVKRSDTQVIREWARENGFKIGDRGAIRKEILDAYEAANS